MSNHKALATLGLGFGTLAIASIGFLTPEAVQQGGIKATPVAFDIPGEVIFVPWPKRTPNIDPNDSKTAISQEFDDMEQALMLFAVVSLNS